jgi:hypothetical protein
MPEMNALDIVGSTLASQLQGGQSMVQPYWCYQAQVPVEREPRPCELVMERVGNTMRLDYGVELRLLIADPIRGIDLRDALQKLKEAMQRIDAIQNQSP